MGVEHQHTADQAVGSPSLNNSVKRARAVPPLDIYRPPAARQSERIANHASPRSNSPAAETKPERTRPARQRRPDIQVYVPRPKRLSAEGRDRVPISRTCMSSGNKSSSLNLRTQANLNLKASSTPSQISDSLVPARECKPKVSDIELHTILPSLDYWCTSSSSPRQYSAKSNAEVSDWTKNLKPAESDNQDNDTVLGSKIYDEEIDMGVGVVMTHKFYAENVQSVNGKKCVAEIEKSQIGIEGGDVGRGNLHRDPDSSTSGQNCDSTPTEQAFDQDSIKTGDRMLKNAQFHSSGNCQETNTVSVGGQRECDTAELVYCEGSGSVKFTDNIVDEVGVCQGLESRSSVSSSGDSIADYCSRYRPSMVTNNGNHEAGVYYNEIKNARNCSQNKISGLVMDNQKPCNSIAEDSGFASKGLDVSFSQDKTHSTLTTCDGSDQFVMCSSTAQEKALLVGEDGQFSNLHGDTNLSHSVGSTEHVEASEDSNIFVSEFHKKDENDECQLQQKQNRKNRRLLTGNCLSDVLIISDSDPLTDIMAPSTQIDCNSENTSLPGSVLQEQKSQKLKGESVCVGTSGPHVKEQSAERHKLSSSSSSSPLSLNLNPDECTWDMLFDDNGECLDPKLMEELTSAVGAVTVEKPQSDYRSYQSRIELMSGAGDDEFSHVVEIYNFPSEFKTSDLCAVFSPYMKGGFEIKWVDDTHALGVFSSSLVAAEVLAADHPFVKTRPLREATAESRQKARRSAEFLQPYRARPETCVALARRLVGGALGVRLNTTREEREAERRLLKEAREKKRIAAKQRDDAWEGTLGEN